MINGGQNILYDVAIIGSGPAGISLALRLSEKYKFNVAIIETGNFEFDPKIQQLSAVEATGDLPSDYYPVHSQRTVGGTSSVWNGYCAPLDKRPFLEKLWPISYEEIDQYYEDASQILDISPKVRDGHRATSSEIITYSTFYMSTPVRFGQKYRKRLENDPNINLITDTTCSKISLKGNRVDGLELTNTLNQKKSRVTAKIYVSACGGIGNPRLLKLSNIGNELPVGKYFLEHPHIHREVSIEIRKSVIDKLLQSIKSDRISHSLHLSDQCCIKNNLLSFSVGFDTDQVEEKIFLGKKQPMYVSKTKIRSEMLATEKNEISLSSKKDFLNQRISKVDFKFDYEEKAKDGWTRFSQELLRSGLGRAMIAPQKFKKITGGGHYMGSTRMGKSPADSVVDGDCKVHGIDNLFVGGSSVFPVSGAANPTLTIVALALRMADYFEKKKGELL